MGITKTDSYADEQVDMALLIKAVGHPARIAILQAISKTKGCVCGDLVDQLPLSQPTVSQHLNELKKVGLIKGSVEGRSICYCLDTDKLQSIHQFIQQLVQDAACGDDLCC
ncbi:MAG TPA: metalloregulator ArsR/SmtB family transcription factor [Luteibaculaceae bacterium]|nr:metalloregulator ArsR/SmtB family transcription factor [Luteibaculaceae bacterium]